MPIGIRQEGCCNSRYQDNNKYESAYAYFFDHDGYHSFVTVISGWPLFYSGIPFDKVFVSRYTVFQCDSKKYHMVLPGGACQQRALFVFFWTYAK